MRRKVWLVQQGVWDLPAASMPLAAGYLKATADADPGIHAHADISIWSFRGGESISAMATSLFRHGGPDVLAFSVQGWNYRAFGALAETFKQLNRDGWVIFGGTHVAHQGDRTFRMFPDVDVVVNGEGELVFADLLRAYLAGTSRGDLREVAGISNRSMDGEMVTTPARERIKDLEIIPSPILSGAIPLADASGGWPYDYALMETNRGCPYKCSFCYWGGAIGQKVRAFSRERVREELEYIARHGAKTLLLCDANFGSLAADEEFVEDLLRVRSKYGYPEYLGVSWAKNKSARFYNIVAATKMAGMQNNFIIALQTLNDTALEQMGRRNMRLNEWRDLAQWLKERDIDCYFELIWGAPGDTVESFLDGYDQLSRHTSLIHVHPLMLLPNTEYSAKRKEFGFVTTRGQSSDFEYLVSHASMTVEENLSMLRFISWNRLLVRDHVLEYTWIALRAFAGISQSSALLNFSEWFADSDDPVIRALEDEIHPSDPKPEASRRLALLVTPDVLRQWWAEAMRPAIPERARALLDEVFRFDLLTQPVQETESSAEDLSVVEAFGQRWYVRRDVPFSYDVPALIKAVERDDDEPHAAPPREPLLTTLYYKVGFLSDMMDHGAIGEYRGRTERDIVKAASRVTA